MLSSGLAMGIVLIGGRRIFSLLRKLSLWKHSTDKYARSSNAVVLVIIFRFYKQLLYITFNEDQARVSGIDVTRLNYLFIRLASLAVIASLRLVGCCNSKHHCDVMNLAPGETIVILSIAILLGSIGAKSILKKNERRSLTKAT